MKFNSYILPLAATAKLVVSHATIQAAWINGADQGLGNSASGYIRSPPSNSPVLDLNSQDLTCNVNGRTAVARTLNVKPGDQFGFEWHHVNRDAGDQIIDPSHKGPVMVYMAPKDAGSAGNNWVKIAEDGYDPSTKKWAVDKLIENRGIHYITVPNVKTGDYLLRGEIIALHEAYRGAAQFYMECVQVRVTSSSSQALPAGVSLPGDYKSEHPGIHFDLYNGFTSYPIPGPAKWDGGSAQPPATTTRAPTTTTRAPTTTTRATTAQPTTSAPSSGGTAEKYGQCGGIGWTGPTKCAAGSTCQPQEGNPYYSQCL